MVYYFVRQESGTAIISLDALFGLPMKKHAGQSHRGPLNGNRYFLQQLDVDNYLTQLSEEPPSTVYKLYNNFQL